MKCLFVDTNIWIRVVSQGKPGCEIAHLEDLRELIDQAAIVLLLPEVVQLELNRQWRSFTENVVVQIGKLEKELEAPLRKSFWSEIEDVQRSLQEFLSEQKTSKLESVTNRYEKVQNLLSLPNVKILEFTPEIHFRARKRLIAGKMPRLEQRSHSDACILESLAVFFSQLNKNDHELCFCSENVADFGLESKDRHIIHPLHKDDLPSATEYCLSLEKAVACLRSGHSVVAPSLEDFEAALQQKREDDVDAEIEISGIAKSGEFCAEANCFAPRFVISRYCLLHFNMRVERLSPERREIFETGLTDLLNKLSYREREIFKLRYGLNDGYVYSRAECGRLFKVTRQRIGQIEADTVNKLRLLSGTRIDDLL